MHTDSSMIMVPAAPLRSDVSTTIFLADPSTYEGGELHVQMGDQSIKIKGEPGSAIIYPSISMHGVEPVTKGERIAAIAFTESYIRDPAKREILYQVQEVSAEEGFNISWENRNRLDFIRNNLRRMWDSE
ncbi:MAG: 2OG-Fe(II) oxygenase [Maricaulis sp.]|nr:2OG-Fe(II) oxygenase [Maricaulis sp.]